MMKQTLIELESSIEKLSGDSKDHDKFILALRDPLESLVGTEAETEVHRIIAGATSDLENGLEPAQESHELLPSEKFRDLHRRYSEAVEHHPALILQIGRLADTFASLGL